MATSDTRGTRPEKGSRLDPRAERSRKAALAAAQELLLESGWSTVTHASVAARSGVGRTTLYRHWPESSLLVQELLADIFNVDHPDRTGELRADLTRELEAFVAVLLNPKADRALRVIIDQAPLDPGYAQVLASCSRKGSEALLEILDDAKKEKTVSESLSVDVALDLLLGPLVFRSLVSGLPFGESYVPDLVDNFLETYGT